MKSPAARRLAPAGAVALLVFSSIAWAAPPDPYARFFAVKQWSGELHCSFYAKQNVQEQVQLLGEQTWDARSSFVLDASAADSYEGYGLWTGATLGQSGRISTKTSMVGEGKVLQQSSVEGSQVLPLDPADATGTLTINSEDGEYSLQVHGPSVRTTTESKFIGPGGLEAQPVVTGDETLQLHSIEHQKLPGGMALTGRADFEETVGPSFSGTVHCDWSVSPGGASKVKVTLDGCANVAVGGSGTLTARGTPAGGTYRWWTEPGQIIALSPLGANAALSGTKAGSATVFVEYSAGGDKAQTSMPATSARVVSINQGGAIPKLGLFDADGKASAATRVVPLQMEPAGDTHFSFPAADPGVATAVGHGSTLELQGVRVGKTTVQGQAACNGPRSGPVANVEVTWCDDAVLAKLQGEMEKIQNLSKQNASQVSDLVNDPEFVRAAKEVAGDIGKALVDTSKLVVSATGLAAKAGLSTLSTGFKQGSDLLSKATTLQKLAKGDSDGAFAGMSLKQAAQLGKDIGSSTLEVSAAAISAANNLASAAGSVGKVARDAGAITGARDRLKELSDRQREYNAQMDVQFKRWTQVCHQGGTQGSGQSATQAPASTGASQPGAGTPPAPPPAGSGQPGSTQPGAGSPAAEPEAGPATPAGGGAGAGTTPASSGGGSSGLLLSGPCDPGAAKEFESIAMPNFQKELEQLQPWLTQIQKAAGLPDAERRVKMKQALPRLEKFVASTTSFGESGGGLVQNMRGCETELPGAAASISASGKKRAASGAGQIHLKTTP